MICIPSPPPDLDCGDHGVPNNIKVKGDDPHGFDGDGDGKGCESNSSSRSNDNDNEKIPMTESQTSRIKVIMKTNMTMKKTERMLVLVEIVMTRMNASQTAAGMIMIPPQITIK